MAEKIISNLQVIVNDELVAYIPSSLGYTGSTGKTIVKGITIGGSSVTTVHSSDLEEATSKVEFEVIATARAINQIDEWFGRVAGNVIELSSSDGVIAEVFQSMSMEEKPMIELGADSKIKLTFLGDPV